MQISGNPVTQLAAGVSKKEQHWGPHGTREMKREEETKRHLRCKQQKKIKRQYETRKHPVLVLMQDKGQVF